MDARPASHQPPVRSANKPLLLLVTAAVLGGAVVASPGSTSGAPTATTSVSRSFFGIAPQTALGEQDIEYMRAGRIGSIRTPFLWHLIQPTPQPVYDWSSVDPVIETAARGGVRVFPFLFGTPAWLSRKQTKLPIDSRRARTAWVAFVKAAVARYGPGGEFWTEKGIARPLPLNEWQVWNEANFFYFAYPVSPSRYARLLKLTYPAIKQSNPRADVILSGLFGDPDERGKRGMDAPDFLDALYRSPGIKSRFDGIALHPYAFHVDDLEALVEQMRAVSLVNRDRRARLYVTEMGWGSQNDPNIVAFEQGIRGQARELRGAYRYLIRNRGRLNLKGTYWFSWKDLRGSCNFCDSVGLFRGGNKFRPKPAWRTFVGISGGRPRP